MKSSFVPKLLLVIVFINAIETHIAQRLGYCCDRSNHDVMMRIVEMSVILITTGIKICLIDTSQPPRDKSQSRMQS